MASLYDLFKLAAPPQPVNPYNSGRPVPQFIQPPAQMPPYTPPKPSLRHPRGQIAKLSKHRTILVPMTEKMAHDYVSGRAIRLDHNTAMNIALERAVQALPARPATPTPVQPPFLAAAGMPSSAGVVPLVHPQSVAAQPAQMDAMQAIMAQMQPMAADVVRPQMRPAMMPRNLLPYGPVPFGARMPG